MKFDYFRGTRIRRTLLSLRSLARLFPCLDAGVWPTARCPYAYAIMKRYVRWMAAHTLMCATPTAAVSLVLSASLVARVLVPVTGSPERGSTVRIQ